MRKQMLLIFSSFLLVSYLHASILHVPSEYAAIQEGIDAAIDGDTVLVASGTYTGPGNILISFLGKAILVTSEMGPDSTVIDGSGHFGFQFHNNENYSSILRGFTISHITHGIMIINASPIIMDCRMLECVVYLLDLGGGIYMINSLPLIVDCSFEYCGAGSQAFAGAIYSEGGYPTIKNSLFFNNYDVEYFSESVYCDAALILNCTFYGNHPRAI